MVFREVQAPVSAAAFRGMTRNGSCVFDVIAAVGVGLLPTFASIDGYDGRPKVTEVPLE